MVLLKIYVFNVSVSGCYFSLPCLNNINIQDLDIISFSSFLPVVFSSQHIQSVLDRIKPTKVLKVYENFYTDRKILYKEFKGNSNCYVYLIVNKLNGKIYVGSTRNLKSRASDYLNPAHLSTYKRPITSAIIKYGLINFAFIVLEQVDTSIYHIEVSETYWIKHLKPDYNATKEAARNEGKIHSEEVKLAISKMKSKGSIYIYNEIKELIVIAPSMISLAILLGSKSISISIKRAIKDGSLYRSSWYLTREPFNINDKPKIEVGSLEYKNLIERMISQKHVKKAIFVFKDGEFICKYDGVMSAARELKISHNSIKGSIDKNTIHKGYRFSYHRVCV